jgi:ABC-type multidrug transport system ATPase subunit
MDPVARRHMWEVISRISTQDAKCSIILTTHSMEEAEALCTRIGISKYFDFILIMFYVMRGPLQW